jgi:hypothetical protein
MYSDPFGEQTISIFSREPSRQLSVSRGTLQSAQWRQTVKVELFNPEQSESACDYNKNPLASKWGALFVACAFRRCGDLWLRQKTLMQNARYNMMLLRQRHGKESEKGECPSEEISVTRSKTARRQGRPRPATLSCGNTRGIPTRASDAEAVQCWKSMESG